MFTTRNCLASNLTRRCNTSQFFLRPCFATLLWHKLHESLPSVTCPETNVSRNFFCCRNRCAREVEVGSTSCNGDCNKNVARHVHNNATVKHATFVWENVQCLFIQTQTKPNIDLIWFLGHVTPDNDPYQLVLQLAQRNCKTSWKKIA